MLPEDLPNEPASEPRREPPDADAMGFEQLLSADPVLDSSDRPTALVPDLDSIEHEVPTVAVLDYSPPASGHNPYAAFEAVPFRIFAGGLMLSSMAQQVISATVAWHVYQQTNSALSLMWIGLVQALPVILLALPAGHVADVLPRKWVMLATQLVIVTGTALLATLAMTDHLSIRTIYIILLVDAIAATFYRPARASLLPALVPLKSFSNAITWNSTIFETCSAVGPWIAGMMIAYYRVPWALVVAAGAMVLCTILTALLPDHRLAKTGEKLGFNSLLSGVRFVFRVRLMFAAMSLDMFAVLFGGAIFLLPIFADGPVEFGRLRAAASVGALVMTVLIAHLPPMRRAGPAMLIAVAIFGAATVVFGLSNNFYLSFAMLVICGMADSVSVVVRHTLVQVLTPDAMRGRVSAVNQVFIGSSNELGGAESALTAWLFGPVISVVAGGLITLGVVATIAVRFPQVRRLRSLQDVRPEPA